MSTPAFGQVFFKVISTHATDVAQPSKPKYGMLAPGLLPEPVTRLAAGLNTLGPALAFGLLPEPVAGSVFHHELGLGFGGFGDEMERSQLSTDSEELATNFANFAAAFEETFPAAASEALDYLKPWTGGLNDALDIHRLPEFKRPEFAEKAMLFLKRLEGVHFEGHLDNEKMTQLYRIAASISIFAELGILPSDKYDYRQKADAVMQTVGEKLLCKPVFESSNGQFRVQISSSRHDNQDGVHCEDQDPLMIVADGVSSPPSPEAARVVIDEFKRHFEVEKSRLDNLESDNERAGALRSMLYDSICRAGQALSDFNKTKMVALFTECFWENIQDSLETALPRLSPYSEIPSVNVEALMKALEDKKDEISKWAMAHSFKAFGREQVGEIINSLDSPAHQVLRSHMVALGLEVPHIHLPTFKFDGYQSTTATASYAMRNPDGSQVLGVMSTGDSQTFVLRATVQDSSFLEEFTPLVQGFGDRDSEKWGRLREEIYSVQQMLDYDNSNRKPALWEWAPNNVAHHNTATRKERVITDPHGTVSGTSALYHFVSAVVNSTDVVLQATDGMMDSLGELHDVAKEAATSLGLQDPMARAKLMVAVALISTNVKPDDFTAVIRKISSLG